MESGTEPSTTTKTKNPKKVEAGRKGAEARKCKREELEKQARAGQARAHAEVSRGDMAAPFDEPHERPKPVREEPLFGDLFSPTPKTWWFAGGCVGLGVVWYVWYRKKSAADTPRPATRPAQQSPAQESPTQPATTSGRRMTSPPVVDRFAE
jgi:hypothetical protein